MGPQTGQALRNTPKKRCAGNGCNPTLAGKAAASGAELEEFKTPIAQVWETKQRPEQSVPQAEESAAVLTKANARQMYELSWQIGVTNLVRPRQHESGGWHCK